MINTEVIPKRLAPTISLSRLFPTIIIRFLSSSVRCSSFIAVSNIACDGFFSPTSSEIVLASKILKKPLKYKIAGIDLGEGIVKYAAASGKKVYFLGAAPANSERKAVALIAEEKLAEKYEGFKLCGWHDGYFKPEMTDDIINDINDCGTDILFVCLGAPRQELWVKENRDKLNVSLILGLGGSLDGYAGTVKRAPEFFIKINCEWLYRLIKQPSRFKRMLKLPKYIFGALGERLRGK